MKLFEIFGEIKIDGDGALKTLTNTDKQGSKTAKSFGKSAKAIGKAGAKAAIGIGAVATGLGIMATKTADAGDRVDKMSQKLGLSRQGFQEWDYILSQNGASIDSMGSGMKTLTNQFDDLASGGKLSTEAFGRLGLSLEDLQGLSQEEIFETTIVALQGMENETERAAIANQLLGRSGQELAPLLNAGADSVENLKNKANDLGLVMGDDAVDASVKFTDTMDTLKRSFGAVGLELGTALIPIFDKLANWIINNMPTIKKVASDAFNFIKNTVDILYDAFETYLLPVLINLYEWVSENMDEIKLVMETVFLAVVAVVTKAWELFKEYLLPVLGNLYNFVKDNWPTFQKIFEVAFEAIEIVVRTVYDIFEVVFDIIKRLYYWAEPAFPLFKDLIVTAFEGIVVAVQTGIDIFNGIKNAAIDAIEWIKDGLKWIGIMNDEGQPGGGGGSSWGANDPIPNPKGVGSRNRTENLLAGFRADGGPVSSGSTYMVGERGPELFTPKTSGSIIPNESMNSITVNTMVVREEADIGKIARELHNLQSQKRRGLAY